MKFTFGPEVKLDLMVNTGDWRQIFSVEHIYRWHMQSEFYATQGGASPKATWIDAGQHVLLKDIYREAAALLGEPALAAALALVLLGPEADPQVLVACWGAQLSLAAEWALDHAGAALMGEDEVRRAAAAEALAESGRSDALRVLLGAIEETVLASDRAPLLRALGLHRSAEAFDALVERVATGSIADALVALEAFALRRVTGEESDRLSGAVTARNEPRLTSRFEAR